jgi:two-component system, sensor histidine kinase LadS
VNWVRIFRVLLFCWLGLGAGAALAADLPNRNERDLAAPSAQAQVSVSVSVRKGVPPDWTLEQVLRAGDEGFVPFDANAIYPAQGRSVSWLRLRVLADTTAEPAGWSLTLSKPYIDRIELYARDAAGQWQMQVAGDQVAQSRWPVRSLYPQFALPPMAGGLHTFYVKVQSNIALHYSVTLQPTEQLTALNQNNLLVTGFVLGFSVFMLGLSTLLAVVYRSIAYGWYSVFVALGIVASSSHFGLAAYLFWPDATWWPEYAVLVPATLGFAVQLHFCRILFLSDSPGHRLQSWVSGALAISAVLVLTSVVAPSVVFINLGYALAMTVCVGLMLLITVRALLQKSLMAVFWLAAYLPLIGVVLVSVMDNFGVAAISALPFHAPIYALMFEMAVLLVALHLHAKGLYGSSVRLSALAAANPLTGFIAQNEFARAAQTLWDGARRSNQDLGVAYVRLLGPERHARPIALTHNPAADQERARVARLLGTVLEEGDALAQVDDRTYAIFLARQSAGENFNSRLSRIVALGLMAGQDASAAGPFRFRIAASTRASVGRNWPALDRALQRKLTDDVSWAKRSIIFLGAVAVNAQEDEISSEVSSEIWADSAMV